MTSYFHSSIIVWVLSKLSCTRSHNTAHMHSVSSHLLTHSTSQEEHDSSGHKLNKQSELDIAKRELVWRKLHSSLDIILAPSVQPYFSTSPDHWVARSPTLIPLTGLHPFNAEAPLPLFTNHLITPNSIHFVRNHGTVPNLNQANHQLSIEGLNGEGSRAYSMDSVISFPPHSIVVTFACDGNRRKELNMQKHTNGFSWGAGAVSTAKWTGVRLVDLFHDIHISSDYHCTDHLHVCFEGSDQLHSGPYGTSLDFRYCMDRLNDVILAYHQNDQPLTPDHGFPLRLIAPGLVGGRQVKWLSRIWLSTSATDNWYHHHDNKQLPSSVSTEAAAMAWWPRTPPLFEMNTVAVITQPTHQEWIDTTKPAISVRTPDPDKPSSPPVKPTQYVIKGFAYSGGGRRIVRVELSLDERSTWVSAMLCYVDGGMDEVASAKFRNNAKCWSWAHWELAVELSDFYHATSITARAFDEAMNTQPERPIWNFLGVMNNSLYEVRVEYNTPHSIRFIHPVQPGQLVDNGWMKRTVDDVTHDGSEFQTQSNVGQRLIPIEEIARHNTKDDCWVILDGRVYDFTPFLTDHPGGDWAIAAWAGQNATDVFHDVHHGDINTQKEMFMIGVVEPPRLPKVLRPSAEGETAIQVWSWVEARVKRRKEVSDDVRLFTLDFPHGKGRKVGLPIGQHVLIGATLAKRRFVVRPYTPVRPIGDDDDDGTMDILLKIYFPKPANDGKSGKPGGLLSMHMEGLKEGDAIRVKGPTGSLIYEGRGWMSHRGRSFKTRRVNLVCGGTGITPAYQLIVAMMKDDEDETRVALVDSNVKPSDVLLREKLDRLAEEHKERLHLFYSVDKGVKQKDEENGAEKKEGKGSDGTKDGEEKHWVFHVGHVDETLLRQHLFPPTNDTVCFVCGPPLMLQLAVYPALERYGFDIKKQVLEF